MNSAVLLSLLFLFAGCFLARANVVLIVHNATFSFQDVEANFAPPVKGSGECGVLYMAEPLDACSTLTNKVEKASNYSSPFVLIVRGGCSFEDKVRRAQKAGFKAAIVYDNEDSGVLVERLNKVLEEAVPTEEDMKIYKSSHAFYWGSK